jgi:small subunit ribosomal protein S2
MKEIEAQLAEPGAISKKEILRVQREFDKLMQSLGGIREMERLPDALFVVDVGYQKIAITEANKLGIPVIGVVDSNNSPLGVDYIIPGNDDSGKSMVIEEMVAATQDEYVEVDEASEVDAG